MNILGKRLIDYVREGMKVVDRRGNRVGEVTLVFSGAYEFLPQGKAIVFMDLNESLLPAAMRTLFPAHRVSAEVRERLFQMGFVQINAGRLAPVRYALDDQIESVGSDLLRLKVTKNDILKL